jgi:hypothetical protein
LLNEVEVEDGMGKKSKNQKKKKALKVSDGF